MTNAIDVGAGYRRLEYGPDGSGEDVAVDMTERELRARNKEGDRNDE
ncbi:MAG TPA: hypothetical protein VIY27_04340 [Myxococcota bacterium]